jgi:hypothetical protein
LRNRLGLCAVAAALNALGVLARLDRSGEQLTDDRADLVDGDGEIAAHCVCIHDGHHIHRAALAPQFDGLRECG